MSLKGILDRQLPKGRGEVSLSAFAFLFSEIIQYCQSTVSNVSELERRYAYCSGGSEIGGVIIARRWKMSSMMTAWQLKT